MNSIVKKIWKSKLWLLITIVALIAVNWLASLYHSRIDFTNEKRFTLSTPTTKVLKRLDDVVKVEVFLKGDFPSGFKKLANSTGEVLQQFKEIAGNKLQYKFISPDEDVDGTNVKWADTLSALGFYPINLTSQVKAGQQQQNIYPVAFIHYKDKVLPVILYQGKSKAITYAEINSAEAMMEYNFISTIDKLIQKEKPIVAYAVGNGEPTGYNTEDLVQNTLQQEYRFYSINLNTQPVIPKDFNVLIIVKPTEPFNDAAKLKLDQFVMNGGKIIFFIDRLNAELDSLQSKKGEVVAYDRGLELNDLLFKYGARINPDLLMDLQCDFLPFDVNGNGQFELLPWNYFPVFETKSNHVINKNLGFLSGRFVN
ncbi:MAG TPA: Gldg family protein, partial [Ferruginibacter sp.]|nr:Gldg family protein [Ferruginibacter sp.]